MKRQIIPKTPRDRFNAVVGLLCTVFLFITLTNFDYWWSAFFLVLAIANLLPAYILQDHPVPGTDASEYSDVIGRIGAMSAQLSELSNFLEREKARVVKTEDAVRKLQEEKTKLEPIVSTQRETIDAILSVHARRMAVNAWKERIYGFILGAFASLAASFVYEYFKR